MGFMGRCLYFTCVFSEIKSGFRFLQTQSLLGGGCLRLHPHEQDLPLSSEWTRTAELILPQTHWHIHSEGMMAVEVLWRRRCSSRFSRSTVQ